MHRLRHILLTTTALMPFALSSAFAGPDGAQLVGGQATVSGQGTANVTVNQSTDKAILNGTRSTSVVASARSSCSRIRTRSPSTA